MGKMEILITLYTSHQSQKLAKVSHGLHKIKVDIFYENLLQHKTLSQTID